MTFTNSLLEGIAARLEAEGIAFRPEQQLPGDVGIYSGGVPAEGSCVVLNAYPVTSSRVTSETTIGVQLRLRMEIRHEPGPVDDLADDIFGALHGLSTVDLGGVHVLTSEHRSGAPLGQDANDRWERTENYHFDVHRPGPRRI